MYSKKFSKMKQFFSMSIVFILMACTTSKQSIFISESLPKLSYQQMLEDHDSLVSKIKQTSPIIYFNKEVRGIDFTQHATILRKQINTKTSTQEFLQIVHKTLNAAQDGHTSNFST